MDNAKTTVDRVWQYMETKQLDRLAEVVAADCHFKMPGAEFRGLDALKQLLTGYLAAFPDLRHEVVHHVASADAIALELRVLGTHDGPMVTPQGTVPATGKKVVWESCDYVRLREGKIASWHVYHDSLPFLSALGLVPA
jgi:ketosteroid isomerase-like protein